MLQQGYAESLGASFLDDQGVQQVPWMGCYGIGTTRLLQAIVQVHHDSDGICWPQAVAPFDVHVMPVLWDNQLQRILAEELAQRAEDAGLSVLLDDRDASPGSKFKDADLIGCPTRATAGRHAVDKKIEIRDRYTASVDILSLDDAVSELRRRKEER
jgi:prolyl-tRNA synthetase